MSDEIQVILMALVKALTSMILMSMEIKQVFCLFWFLHSSKERKEKKKVRAL